ncbi:MAG: insulinase family protein [Gemmatimonadaceae bacterium]|nr:insulinase family protein [Gemmatimonadaceae bacterium]
MRGIRQLTVSAALLTAAAALAPAPGDAQAVPSIRVERYVLPNGLEVLLHEDHSTPIVAVDTWYHVGSSNEQRGRTGFAHLFEHIMFMGSQHVPVGAFDQWLESAGAYNNGSTTQDRTNYYEVMPSNALPLALWLDADRMGWLLPTMDQAKLDLQRDVVKNERRERVDNVPYGRASETILGALFPKSHPYSWPVIGSMADLSAASLEDVKSFFRTYYAPNNATLTIAGDFNADSVKAWVNHYFAQIPRGPAVPSNSSVPAIALQHDTVLVLEDRVQLPRLYYTWRTPKALTQDDAALDVLAFILAGDKSSRLYTKLVYQAQSAQQVNANQASARLDSWFQVVVAPKEGHMPAEMAAAVDSEIARLAKEGPTQREVQRAQNSYRTTFLDAMASVLGKAEQLNRYDYLVGQPDYAREDAVRYDRVTPADVQRVAAQYLTAPKVVLTIVPQGKTEMAVKGGTR